MNLTLCSENLLCYDLPENCKQRGWTRRKRGITPEIGLIPKPIQVGFESGLAVLFKKLFVGLAIDTMQQTAGVLCPTDGTH